MRRALPTILLMLATTLAPGAPAQDMQFVDVPLAGGLDHPLGLANGVAVGDYDGDGWLDVGLFGASGNQPQIFRNNGARIAAGAVVPWFTNVSATVMPADAERSSMGMFADLDGDADHDLVAIRRYPTVGNPNGSISEVGVMYYENRGGTFVKGASPADLARYPATHGGLALADLDGDSDLDIIATHNDDGTFTGAPAFYVRNDGIPDLVDFTSHCGPSDLATHRRYFSAVLADFNGDMLPDLHVAVDWTRDHHCRNLGAGLLQDVSLAVGTSNAGSDMGLAVGDIENDGDLDIFSTNIWSHALYVNDGVGNFTNEAAQRGLVILNTFAWGTGFADFDHDGDEDLVFVANGSPGRLMENDGAGYFTDVTSGSGMFLDAYALIPFDYDRDGDVDILIVNKGLSETPHLYENVSPALEGRHWLIVDPVGTVSNRDGVGAFVRVTVGGVTLTRTILAGYSYRSGPPMLAHFGLRGHEVVDEVRITWPSGIVQRLTNVAVDRYLTVVEG